MDISKVAELCPFSYQDLFKNESGGSGSTIQISPVSNRSEDTRPMKPSKRKRRESKGFRVGTVAEFLGLSAEEEAFVEMKLALSSQLRQRRERLNLTQVDLARRIGSSQSRIAKMEAADASVSLDLLIRSLLATGATTADVCQYAFAGQIEPHGIVRTVICTWPLVNLRQIPSPMTQPRGNV